MRAPSHLSTCSRARERRRLQPGLLATTATTHRAAKPEGRAPAGPPKPGVLAVAIMRYRLRWKSIRRGGIVILSSELRGFAPSCEPYFALKPRRA